MLFKFRCKESAICWVVFTPIAIADSVIVSPWVRIGLVLIFFVMVK